MPKFVNIDVFVKNYIRSVSGITNTDAVINVSGNILTRPASIAALASAGLAEFAVNTSSFALLRTYVNDSAAKANTATSLSITLAQLEAMLVSMIDSIAAVHGLKRRPATPSTGTVVVGVNSFPLNNDVIIPAGVNFNSTIPGSTRNVRFSGISSATIPFSTRAAFFNASTGLYEVEIPVISGEAGSFTNMPIGAINEVLTALPAVDSVVNRTPTLGGTDIESNGELVDRLIGTIKGSGVGTIAGYDAIVRNVPGVVDVAIVGAGDPLMKRDGGMGGAVDIWVITNDITTATDTFTMAV